MWWNGLLSVLVGSAAAWFILILIVLALALWFISWRLFPEHEPVPVGKTLEGLKGMDPVMAGKLVSFGIRTDRDLMRLTPRGQQELESQLGLHHGEYDGWRNEILTKWRGLFLPEAFRDVPEVIPDPELGAVYPRRPKETDDLTKLPGIERITASRMNHAGIYTYEQLRLMMPEQRACFKQRFHLDHFDFDKLPEYGVSARWLAFQQRGSSSGEAAEAVTQAETMDLAEPAAAESDELVAKAPVDEPPASAPIAASLEATESPTELAGIEGIDQQLADKLALVGAVTERDLMHWTTEDKQRIQTQLGLPMEHLNQWQEQVTTRWREQYMPAKLKDNPRLHPDREFGAVFAQKPRVVDDLTRVVGVDAEAATNLNQAGIYTFEQLRLMSPQQLDAVRERFQVPKLDVDSVPSYGVTAQWLNSLPAEEDSPKEVASDKQETAGSPPPSAGELTASRSEASDASEASEAGQREPQDTEVKSPAPQPDTLQEVFRETAVTASRQGIAEVVDTYAPDLSEFTIPRTRFDAELGRVYTSRPPHRDDLTNVAGITTQVAQQLNASGIYTIDQIRSLSLPQRERFKLRFDVPEFDFTQWATARSELVPAPHFAIPAASRDDSEDTTGTQSAESAVSPDDSSTPGEVASAGMVEPLESDSKRVTGFAAVTAEQGASAVADESSATNSSIPSTSADSDDLTRLPGVDENIAERMRAMGISHLRQVAELSLADQVKLRSQLGLASFDYPEWKRLIFAWSQGVSTSTPSEASGLRQEAWLHSVRLPELAPGVFDGQSLVAYPEQVIYRGSQPEFWGTSVSHPREGVTKSLEGQQVRADINYLRLRRLDTRASVVTSISKANLYAPSPDRRNGWNGLCEEYRGARHLGIFASYLPREVETKFGFGGWGFGHQTQGDDAGASQAFGWGGQLIPPTDFEISVGRVGASLGTVVFRSDDPTLWNQAVYHFPDHWATEIEAVTHAIRYVRIMRVDTAQAVIVEADRASLTGRSDHPEIGWNGLQDRFHGGCHLGIYHPSAAGEVEVTFGVGGWGFGHLAGCDNQQAYGWAGRPIGKTVFEVSVFESVPGYLRDEILGSR